MAGTTVTPEGITIPEPRLTLAQESAWELDALRNTVNDLCSDLGHPDLTQCHMMALRLKIRGLTMRMGELASVIMSGVTPNVVAPKAEPVRPKPVMTSSKMSKMPCASHSARKRSR